MKFGTGRFDFVYRNQNTNICAWARVIYPAFAQDSGPLQVNSQWPSIGVYNLLLLPARWLLTGWQRGPELWANTMYILPNHYYVFFCVGTGYVEK